MLKRIMIFLLILTSFNAKISYAIDKQQLHFAGLFLLSQSDASSKEAIKKEFKHLSIIMDDTYYQAIADKLRNKLIENKDLPFVVSENFGRISSNDGIALGLVFSKENFVFLPFQGSQDKVLLDGFVLLNLVIFDFKKNTLIDFTPFPINFAEKFNSRIEAEEWIKNKMLKQYLLLNDDKFYQILIKKLKSVNLVKKINRFQVREVKFEAPVMDAMASDNVDINAQKIYVAQQLESALSYYLPITLIPENRGAIDDASFGLISVFSDRDSIKLTSPKPDYYFDVTVRDLKLIKSPAEGEFRRVADILSYGVFNTIEVKDSTTNETKFSAKFFKKASDIIKKENSENISPEIKWGYFNIEQFKLFLIFAEQIKEKNIAKLKTITNNESLLNDLKTLNQLVSK